MDSFMYYLLYKIFQNENKHGFRAVSSESTLLNNRMYGPSSFYSD